jgi:hypothetical protein
MKIHNGFYSFEAILWHKRKAAATRQAFSEYAIVEVSRSGKEGISTGCGRIRYTPPWT